MESNVLNVKDLPQAEEIINGDLLIVERPNGTQSLDFKDFIVGPDNVSFYNTTIVGLSTTVSSLSTSAHAEVVALSSDSRNYVNTKLADVKNYFYYNTNITLNAGAKNLSFTFDSIVSNLNPADINLVYDYTSVGVQNLNEFNAQPFLIQLIKGSTQSSTGKNSYTVNAFVLSAMNASSIINATVQRAY